MRTVLVPLVALACMGTGGEANIETLNQEPRLVTGPGVTALDTILAQEGTNILSGDKLKARQDYLRSTCRDRLVQTDKDDGRVPPGPLALLQRFERKPATPQKPQAIYAVDRREDGCGVMVMMGNPSDVRPVPSIDADDHRLMPAETPED
ncbi:MAG: hypothetical protein AAFN48_12910 [Pseudomonadota bacterium]